MNKEWFVFKGTHHLGPFTIEEMVVMFHGKEIQSQSLVWREGFSKWDAFDRVSEFSFLFAPVKKPKLEVLLKEDEVHSREEFELPPPLPEIPALPKLKPKPMDESKDVGQKIKTYESSESSEFDDDLPPPIPLEVIIGSYSDQKEVIHKKAIESASNKNVILILASLGLVLVMGWYWYLQDNAEVQIRIRGLMPVYLEKLELNAIEKSNHLKIALALSLDGKILWATANTDSPLESNIKLFSVPKRVLGSEEVEVSVKGQIQKHVGKFDRMVLMKGSKFLPGEYRFVASAKEIHFLNRKFKKLSEISLFRSLNSTHEYEGRALIYSGTPREFEKRISDYQLVLTTELLKPFQEKLERVQTLESLLNATSQNFLMELDRAKNAQGIKAFEKKYIREISPVLQSLVLKALELSKDPKFNEASVPGAIAPYREQVILGKQIGEMASEMISTISKKKTLTASEKVHLKNEFERKSRAIKLQIDLNLRKIEEEIRKINRN